MSEDDPIIQAEDAAQAAVWAGLAKPMHQMFVALREEGFTEAQAMLLVESALTTLIRPNRND